MLSKPLLKQGCQTLPWGPATVSVGLGGLENLISEKRLDTVMLVHHHWEPAVEHLSCYPEPSHCLLFLPTYVCAHLGQTDLFCQGEGHIGKTQETSVLFLPPSLSLGIAFKARVGYLIHLPSCKPDERWLWSLKWNPSKGQERYSRVYTSCL